MIFGHLISMGKVVSKLPNRVHPHVYPHYLTKEYDLPPVFYIDAYPIREPMMVVLDPEAAQEVCNSGLLKHPDISTFIKPLAGVNNLVTMDGPAWKKWRTVFSMLHLKFCPCLAKDADSLFSLPKMQASRFSISWTRFQRSSIVYRNMPISLVNMRPKTMCSDLRKKLPKSPST